MAGDGIVVPGYPDWVDISGVVAKATTVLEPDEPEPGPATLRDILETLGPHTLRFVTGDDALLDEPTGEPMVIGPDEPVYEVGNRIVLLTGGRAHQADLLDCLRRVAAVGGRVVVVKAWGHDLAVVEATAKDAGLTLLGTPDDMAWRHLDGLITAARASTTTIGGDDGSPGDLFALANAIAASVGGAVTIEATTGRVMAYSNLPGQEIDEIRRLAIIGRQTPDRPSNTSEYQAVLKASGPVFFESSDPDYADRMAIAVRAGHQVLGAIFVLCDRPGLVPDADRVLSAAARSTALHLLRSIGRYDPFRTRRGEALRGLLTDDLDPAAAADALGLPVESGLVIAVIRPVSSSGLGAAEAAQITDLVILHGEYWHPAAASVLEGREVAVLLPVTGAPEDDTAGRRLEDRLRRMGTGLVTAAKSAIGADLLVGFGPVVPGLAEVSRSRRLAGQVLDALERATPVQGGQRAGVATLGDVRNEIVLTALRACGVIDEVNLQVPAVRAMLAHDAEQGTDYARTLLTYLDCFGNIIATAQALNVHDNTVRYRIRRVTESFGVQLGAGDDTLVTWLQLHSALADAG